MMGYGLFFWAPSHSWYAASIWACCKASLSFGALTDGYGEKRRAMYAFIPAIAFVATVPFYAAGVLELDAPALRRGIPAVRHLGRHGLLLGCSGAAVLCREETGERLGWIGRKPSIGAVHSHLPPHIGHGKNVSTH